MIISAYLSAAGYTDIGYQFYNPNETANGSRITAGVVDAGDGWYSASVTLPGGVTSVRWNSAGQPQVIAREYFPATVDNNAIAVAVWQVLVSTLTTAGSVGKLVADNLDAKVSTRSTYAGTDTAGTTTLLSRIASVLAITAGKVDVNDKTGFSLTSAYDAAKVAAPAGAAMTLTPAERLTVADALLKRDWVQVSGEADESVLNALRCLRNKWTLDIGGTLTVYREDGTSVAWVRNVTTDPSAAPVIGMS